MRDALGRRHIAGKTGDDRDDGGVIALRVDPSLVEHPTKERETHTSRRSFNPFARCPASRPSA
jgi:hypothetical protein